MRKKMALLAVAYNRQSTIQELTVEVIEIELETEILTLKTIKLLSKKLFHSEYNLDINIRDKGKRAKVIHTLESGKTEELQIYLFHTQVIQKHLLQ